MINKYYLYIYVSTWLELCFRLSIRMYSPNLILSETGDFCILGGPRQTRNPFYKSS
jgi:hypothetical protein